MRPVGILSAALVMEVRATVFGRLTRDLMLFNDLVKANILAVLVNPPVVLNLVVTRMETTFLKLLRTRCVVTLRFGRDLSFGHYICLILGWPLSYRVIPTVP